MPNPFDQSVYRECCGQKPKFMKDGGWWARCPVCKWAATSKDGKPAGLAEAWNASLPTPPPQHKGG